MSKSRYSSIYTAIKSIMCMVVALSTIIAGVAVNAKADVTDPVISVSITNNETTHEGSVTDNTTGDVYTSNSTTGDATYTFTVSAPEGSNAVHFDIVSGDSRYFVRYKGIMNGEAVYGTGATSDWDISTGVYRVGLDFRPPNLTYGEKLYIFEMALTRIGDIVIPKDPDIDAYIPVVNDAPAHEHSWVHGIISEPTENSDGLEGDFCTGCGAVANTSSIPAVMAIVANKLYDIEVFVPGKDNIIELGRMNSLSKNIMEKIAAKNDCDFIFRFTTDNNINIELYIPAGSIVDTSLDWYGPAKLMELYDYKVLN